MNKWSILFSESKKNIEDDSKDSEMDYVKTNEHEKTPISSLVKKCDILLPNFRFKENRNMSVLLI